MGFFSFLNLDNRSNKDIVKEKINRDSLCSLVEYHSQVKRMYSHIQESLDSFFSSFGIKVKYSYKTMSLEPHNFTYEALGDVKVSDFDTYLKDWRSMNDDLLNSCNKLSVNCDNHRKLFNERLRSSFRTSSTSVYFGNGRIVYTLRRKTIYFYVSGEGYVESCDLIRFNEKYLPFVLHISNDNVRATFEKYFDFEGYKNKGGSGIRLEKYLTLICSDFDRILKKVNDFLESSLDIVSVNDKKFKLQYGSLFYNLNYEVTRLTSDVKKNYLILSSQNKFKLSLSYESDSFYDITGIKHNSLFLYGVKMLSILPYGHPHCIDYSLVSLIENSDKSLLLEKTLKDLIKSKTSEGLDSCFKEYVSCFLDSFENSEEYLIYLLLSEDVFKLINKNRLNRPLRGVKQVNFIVCDIEDFLMVKTVKEFKENKNAK